MSGTINFSGSTSPTQSFNHLLPTPSSKTEAGQGLTPSEAAASVKEATPVQVDKTISPPADGDVSANRLMEQQTKVMVGTVMTSKKAAQILGVIPKGSGSVPSLSTNYQVNDLKAALKTCTNRLAFRDRFDVNVAPSFKKYLGAKESGDAKAIIQANIELSKSIETYQALVSKEPQPRKGIGGIRDIELQELQSHLESEFEFHLNAICENKKIPLDQPLQKKMNQAFSALKQQADANVKLLENPKGWDVLRCINDARYSSNNFQFYCLADIAVKLSENKELTAIDREHFQTTFFAIKETLVKRRDILAEGLQDAQGKEQQSKMDKMNGIDTAVTLLDVLSFHYGTGDDQATLASLLKVIEELFVKVVPNDRSGDETHSFELNLSGPGRKQFLAGLNNASLETNNASLESVFSPIKDSVLKDMADALKGLNEEQFQSLKPSQQKEFIAAFL